MSNSPRRRRLLLLPLSALLILPIGTLAPAHARAPEHRAAAAPRMSHAAAQAALRHAEALFHRDSRIGTATPRRMVDGTPIMARLAAAVGSLSGTDRQAAQRILARPTDSGGDCFADNADGDCVEAFRLAASKLTTLTTAHFAIHYLSTTQYPDSANATTPRQAELTAETLEHVYATEIGQMGFQAPLPDSDVPTSSSNPSPNTIDIYLGELSRFGIYGYCAPDDESTTTSSAYCSLDNDFAESQYDAPPLNSLEVTAAHEFFHAVQFGYNTYSDQFDHARWLMEGTAVWMEDRVYNSVNDYLQYVPASPIARPWVPFDFNGQYSVYGDFSLFKFLCGYYHDTNFVRELWQAAGAGAAHGITPMQVLTQVLAAHRSNLRTAATEYGVWNTLPPHTYPERASYKPAGYWHQRLLSAKHRSVGTLSTQVRPLATAPLQLFPSRHLRARTHLTIKLAVPTLARGGAAMLQIRYRDGSVRVTPFGLTSQGTGSRRVSFNPTTVSSVVVTLTNGSTATSRWFTAHAWLS